METCDSCLWNGANGLIFKAGSFGISKKIEEVWATVTDTRCAF